jgi:SulP family sulfate permease
MDAGIDLKLIHLSPECKMLLLKGHPNLEPIIESSIEDPRYHVVTDMMDEEV